MATGMVMAMATATPGGTSTTTTTRSSSEGPQDHWHRDEVHRLVRAWRYVVGTFPDAHAERQFSLIYQKFQALSGGAKYTLRTSNDTRGKKASLVHSHQLICAYNAQNQQKLNQLGHMHRSRGGYWFSISEGEQAQVTRDKFKAQTQFTHLDRKVFERGTAKAIKPIKAVVARSSTGKPKKRRGSEPSSFEYLSSDDHEADDLDNSAFYSDDSLARSTKVTPAPPRSARARGSAKKSPSAKKKARVATKPLVEKPSPRQLDFSRNAKRKRVVKATNRHHSSTSDDSGCDGHDERKNGNFGTDSEEEAEEIGSDDDGPSSPRAKSHKEIDPELVAMLNILEKQGNHVAAMLRQINDERQAEKEELERDREQRRLFEAEKEQDRQEMLRDLDEMRAQRDELHTQWEASRVERAAQCESDRQLLRELVRKSRLSPSPSPSHVEFELGPTRT